jgi:hypothetical protein
VEAVRVGSGVEGREPTAVEGRGMDSLAITIPKERYDCRYAEQGL